MNGGVEQTAEAALVAFSGHLDMCSECPPREGFHARVEHCPTGVALFDAMGDACRRWQASRAKGERP